MRILKSGLLLLGLFCAATASAQTVEVGTTAELVAAVNAANAAGGNRTILLRDGLYTLTDTLYVNAPNITLAGLSADRTKATVQGDAMSATAKVGNLVRVGAKNFTLHHLTLQRAGWHAIQIAGEADADNAVITDCILRDTYEQIVKVSKNDATPTVTADNGRIENCEFRYTAGIGPQYYIGGVDAHGARNWVIRGNSFFNIASPNTTVSEFAVHFWNASADNIVERNVIVDCDRGVGFGLQGRGNSGGIIRNNMVYHSANSAPFADVGIALADSPGTSVYNNTLLFDNGYPTSIEYRFAATTGVLIANNLSNRSIAARDGGTGTLGNNVTSATAALFTARAVGNLHLPSALAGIVDSGRAITGLTDDFDGQARPSGAGIDIGADEFGLRPSPPSNLRVQ